MFGHQDAFDGGQEIANWITGPAANVAIFAYSANGTAFNGLGSVTIGGGPAISFASSAGIITQGSGLVVNVNSAANLAAAGYSTVNLLQMAGTNSGTGNDPTNTSTGFNPDSFSISDWSGYPSDVPKPTGPFRLLTGAEYKAARKAADQANAALHKANPAKYAGKQIHV